MVNLAKDGGPKVRSKAWPQRGQRFGQAELRQLREALEQNTLFYAFGQKTRQLCRKMGQYVGAKHVLACSSCSAAIHGAVKACGVGPGDEVITSPITDAGTVLGTVYEGAIPIFADIDPTTYSISARTIEARITPRTRAVIVVHLAGCPADIRPIVRLCRRRKLKLIEDCAQSWGAKVDGQAVGTFGDVGCYSLNDFKHISAGDGGLIVTNDEELYRHAWLAIDKCYDRTTGSRAMQFVAPNYRITELQSAVAIAQLGRVRGITARRHELGSRLTEGLWDIPGVVPHRVIDGGYGTYWFYLIRIDADYLGVDAKSFAEAMAAEGIPVHAGYVEPLYLAYPYLRNRTAFNHSDWPFGAADGKLPYHEGACPNAEKLLRQCLYFPLGEWLTPREIRDTIAATRKVAAHYRGQKRPRRAARLAAAVG